MTSKFAIPSTSKTKPLFIFNSVQKLILLPNKKITSFISEIAYFRRSREGGVVSVPGKSILYPTRRF